MKHLELLQLNKTPCFKRANYVSGCCCYSVAKLQPHGLQHARLPCQSANSRSLLKLMSIELTTPSNHLILCRPLLLPPSIFPSIRVFSNEWVLRIRWPKYWSFSFNISPTNEHPGLISFRMDWLDLLAVQGTLKSLLQHHSSKASILTTVHLQDSFRYVKMKLYSLKYKSPLSSFPSPLATSILLSVCMILLHKYII